MEYHNDSPSSTEVEEYEEFEEKYNNPEFGIFIETKYGKKYFPKPFINIADERKDLLYLDTDSLPRISDSIYREIKMFPDYDYTNSIAFEMLIRTKEYKLIDKDNRLNDEERAKAFEKLGVNLSEIHRLVLRNVTSVYSSNNLSAIQVYAYCDLKISDIDNGLEKLISFYLERQKIYTRIDQRTNHNSLHLNYKFEINQNITLDKIKNSPSKYFIPNKLQGQSSFSCIDKNIFLVVLHDEFLSYIKDDIPNNIKGKISFSYSRPLIKFKESANMNLSINLNLPEKTLIEQIKKLKKDFEGELIKTPINYLYNEYYQPVDWKNDATFKVSKKSISEAFFVYDLYNRIDLIFDIKKNELQTLRDKEIKKVVLSSKKEIESIKNSTEKSLEDLKKNKNLTTKQKDSSVKAFKYDRKSKIVKVNKEKDYFRKEIKSNYKNKLIIYNTESVLIELASNQNISAHMSKQYLRFMRLYINQSGYKQIILGIKLR